MKYQQLINELSQQLRIVEGRITELLTRDTVENLNSQQGQNITAGALAVSGQIGSAALSYFAASDEGIDITDFAIEVTDINDEKHYFKGRFPEVIFKVGDDIKVVAEPLEGEGYARAAAMIDTKNNYLWTSQEVIKGRLRYRIFGMKFLGGIGVFGVFLAYFVFFCMDGISFLYANDAWFVHSLFIFCFLLMLFFGWRLGASFDEQSVELEAIAHRLGFYNPKMVDLSDYTISMVRVREKKSEGQIPDRWEQYTYRLDKALEADHLKYSSQK